MARRFKSLSTPALHGIFTPASVVLIGAHCVITILLEVIGLKFPGLFVIKLINLAMICLKYATNQMILIVIVLRIMKKASPNNYNSH